jgi:TRAP-type C4-dicarboxylate transport system substrate-binding protein
MFEPLLMSKAIFDALPADQQRAIEEVGLELEKFAATMAKADERRCGDRL